MTQSVSRELSASATAAYDPIEVLSLALTAPSPEPLEPPAICEKLAVLSAKCPTDLPATALAAQPPDRLTKAALAAFPDPATLAEAVYELRAFAKDAAAANGVADMKAYLAAAVVPTTESELALDRAIAEGQVAYGVLVTEPKRMPTAELAFEHFRDVYARRYTEHHASYWNEAAALAGKLTDAERKMLALTRLNTISELGAPVGEAAVESAGQLAKDVAGCPFDGDLAAVLILETACPACSLRLADEPPREQIAEVLDRVDRAIARQMSRLSSVAIRAILERSDDPRVRRFLQIVQATQITTLADVLDEDLVGYLRRFLFEARINSLLEPILDRVQHGRQAGAGDTLESLEQLADVLHRAIRGASRALEAPESNSEGP